VPLKAVHRGLSRAIAESPVDASLILSFERHLSESKAAVTFSEAQPYMFGVSAVGLAGSEVGNPPGNFADVFFQAAAAGLHRTAHAGAGLHSWRLGPGTCNAKCVLLRSSPQALPHTQPVCAFLCEMPMNGHSCSIERDQSLPPSPQGEEGGAHYVWDAIRALRVERIDHGIRALEDPQLVAAMAAARLPITLCPLSNLRLQVYAGELEARVREVLASGLAVTINSDDPAYFGRWGGIWVGV
jgi:adenosine deaminase